MPKVSITYNLPEESYEYKIAINAVNYYSVIYELDQWLRSNIKHNDNPPKITEIRDKLWELLNEENISGDF